MKLLNNKTQLKDQDCDKNIHSPLGHRWQIHFLLAMNNRAEYFCCTGHLLPCLHNIQNKYLVRIERHLKQKLVKFKSKKKRSAKVSRILCQNMSPKITLFVFVHYNSPQQNCTQSSYWTSSISPVSVLFTAQNWIPRRHLFPATAWKLMKPANNNKQNSAFIMYRFLK